MTKEHLSKYKIEEAYLIGSNITILPLNGGFKTISIRYSHYPDYVQFLKYFPQNFKIDCGEIRVDLTWFNPDANKPEDFKPSYNLIYNDRDNSIFYDGLTCTYSKEYIYKYIKSIGEIVHDLGLYLEKIVSSGYNNIEKISVYSQSKTNSTQTTNNAVELVFNLTTRLMSIHQSKFAYMALHIKDFIAEWPYDFLTTLILLDSFDTWTKTSHKLYSNNDMFIVPTCNILPKELETVKKLGEPMGTKEITALKCIEFCDSTEIKEIKSRFAEYHSPWTNITDNDVKYMNKILTIITKILK